jgi:predicted transcriptional regulator
MSQALTVEERILDRLFRKLESDESIPREIVRRIQVLRQSDRLKDPDAILEALAQGVKEHVQNSKT